MCTKRYRRPGVGPGNLSVINPITEVTGTLALTDRYKLSLASLRSCFHLWR